MEYTIVPISKEYVPLGQDPVLVARELAERAQAKLPWWAVGRIMEDNNPSVWKVAFSWRPEPEWLTHTTHEDCSFCAEAAVRARNDSRERHLVSAEHVVVEQQAWTSAAYKDFHQVLHTASATLV